MRVTCLGWSDWLELSYETKTLQNVSDEAVHKSESDFTVQFMIEREPFRMKSITQNEFDTPMQHIRESFRIK